MGFLASHVQRQAKPERSDFGAALPGQIEIAIHVA
jgi:hypothetical protein